MEMKRLCAAALAGLLVITGVPVVGNQTLVANAAESTNIALSTAGSSVVAWDGVANNHSKDNMIDGNTEKTDANRWESGVALKSSGQSTGRTAYLVIDLGENTTASIDDIYVYWHVKVWATSYKIETSDTCTLSGANASADLSADGWETVAEVTGRDNGNYSNIIDRFSENGTDHTDIVEPGSDNQTNDYPLQTTQLKRYVLFKFTGINSSAAGDAVSIREIEIHGKKYTIENVALGGTQGTSKVVAWDGVANNYGKDNVIDGNTGTRWESGTDLKNGTTTDAQPTGKTAYLVLDLGENTTTKVDTISVEWHMKVWATAYTVETADTYSITKEGNFDLNDSNWSLVGEITRENTNIDGITDTFFSGIENESTTVEKTNSYKLQTNTLKRYVCFKFTGINVYASGGNNVSIKEIKINGVRTSVPAKFSKASLSLKDSINVNLFVNILNGLETDAQVEFSAAGKESKTISGLNQNKEYDDSYKVSYEMNAAEMTKPITAIISNLGKENDPVTLRYSIKEYADAAMVGASESLQALIKAMLNYGAYSQINFNKTEDGLANAGYAYTSSELDAVTAERITVAAPTFGTDNGVSVTDVSLLLKSKTILRFYLDVAEGTGLTGATVTADGVTGISATIDEQKRYVQIEGIAAKDLDKVYTLTLSTGSGDKVVTYSPLNYVKTVLGSEYDFAEYTNIRNVAKTLYLYNQAAKTYFSN